MRSRAEGFPDSYWPRPVAARQGRSSESVATPCAVTADLDALKLDADDTRIPQSRSIGLLLPVRRGQSASDQPLSLNPIHRLEA